MDNPENQLNLFCLPQIQPYHYRTAKAILERFCAGDTIADLSYDYCCDRIHIEDALRQEINLKLAPKNVRHLKKLLAAYIPGECSSSKFKKLLYIIRYANEKNMVQYLPDWILDEYKIQLGLFLQEMCLQKIAPDTPETKAGAG